MRKARSLRGGPAVLMPASALLPRQPLDEQSTPGLDLVVVMPAEPGRVHDVVMAVIAGATKRGWRVRTVPSSVIAPEHPTAQGAVCIRRRFTPRK